MDADTWQVQLAPGDGLVARSGRVLLLARPKGVEQESFTAALREAIEAVVRADAATPGRRVARSVAGLVAAADDDSVPPLVVVAATDDGLALLLVGDVDVEVVGAEGSVEELSGRDAATWVDRVVRGDLGSVTARVGPGTELDRRSDFGGGTVTASGFRLTPVRSSTATPPAAPAAPVAATPPDEPTTATDIALQPGSVQESSASFVAVSLTDPLPPEELTPLPVLDETRAVQVGAVQVQGIVCSRGHFNDPTSIYCATCGISMVHQTHNLVAGPRPPLGVVVLDDGAVFPLNEDYVIGREPESSAEVRAGRALPMPLDDPDATVSREHARIVLQGWDVRVVDTSSNGTFMATPGAVDWTRLPAGEPTTIVPGTRLTMGGRSLVFDSHRKH